MGTLRILSAVALGSAVALAVGCGEPFMGDNGDSCSDRQCTRSVLAGNLTFCVRGLPEGSSCATDDDCYMQLECLHVARGLPGTCAKAGDTQVAWQGYLAVAVAVLCFGSNFIPARRIDPGNGLFFQLFMSTAILTVGFIVQMVRQTTTFYPYAMLGGMLWALGNTLAMPALKMLSMGLAISIWGGSNMMLGWASGHFGFWGIKRETVAVEWIGYLGVAFAGVGVIVLAFVEKTNGSHRSASDSLLGSRSEASVQTLNPFERIEYGDKFEDRDESSGYFSTMQMRVLGVFLAVASGCFFGINFDPPTLLMDEFDTRSLKEDTKYSPNGLDYVFSHFFGIFLTTVIEVVIFTAADKLFRLPTIFVGGVPYEEMILPGFVSGVGWAMAQVAWFIANDNLGLVVSFPIITLGPSIVGSLWSVFLFREIRGARNYLLLLVAFVLLAGSATCTVFARNGFP